MCPSEQRFKKSNFGQLRSLLLFKLKFFGATPYMYKPHGRLFLTQDINMQNLVDLSLGYRFKPTTSEFYMVIRLLIIHGVLIYHNQSSPRAAIVRETYRAQPFALHAQEKAAICGARLLGFLTGESKVPPSKIIRKDADDKAFEVPNPDHDDWEATDQQFLSYLLSSLSKEILIQVSSTMTTAQAWTEIQGTFTSQIRAQTVNIWLALGNTRKGDSSVTEYFGKMKALGDEMATIGHPLEDEELVQYIITDLDEEYMPLVFALFAPRLIQFRSASCSCSS
jgi:hypothetical protein